MTSLVSGLLPARGVPVDVVTDARNEPGQLHQVAPIGLGIAAEAGAVAVRPAVPLPAGQTARRRSDDRSSAAVRRQERGGGQTTGARRRSDDRSAAEVR